MAINCVVVDAGARYGLHPTWADLQGVVEFHLFEMDPAEAMRLQRKYQADSLITVYPLALYSCDTTLNYRVNQHHALNSVFPSNDELLRQNEYKVSDFTVTDGGTAEARSIDSLFSGRDLHFLKLDVEGAEAEVIRGATEKLTTSTLGVRSEVTFAPIYRDAPMFGDINSLLLDLGFELLNLDYTGAGNKAGRFTKPGRYGKLMSTDAVWVVSNDRLFTARGDRLRDDMVRLALFLMNNGATDLAIDMLLRAVRDGISFDPVKDEPLFRALHRKALLLFKGLLELPMLQEEDITGSYRTIFGAEFPLLNKFYESIN
jgi:FkbM family methyltransferase